MSRVFRGIRLNGYRILGDDHNQKVSLARSCGKAQKIALIAEHALAPDDGSRPSALRYLDPAETNSRAYADWE
jgi:hypothetical protein